jgi:hypothetical protein
MCVTTFNERLAYHITSLTLRPCIFRPALQIPLTAYDNKCNYSKVADWGTGKGNIDL